MILKRIQMTTMVIKDYRPSLSRLLRNPFLLHGKSRNSSLLEGLAGWYWPNCVAVAAVVGNVAWRIF